ncbi:TonB-dependent receptor [Prevotella sp. A2931]|uniref:TonB-dependent receptor n=1 Tax=Prevotella illustrans TaxID=2800387 RepID=A0ABS3M6N9_9BACT|nr:MULTISPECIES: outer membrane beta-barrel protein [Prevotella]MBO1363844.1 TonB-dependent receptor [Prevotella illustrans]PTL27106.1 TonB-dependent receptor [Prevotella sp. oral taxon 820]
MKLQIFWRNLLLLPVLALCSFHTLSAQTKVSGSVVDESGQAVMAAVVVLLNGNDKAVAQTAVTDENGRFVLTTAPGTYVLNIRYLGYAEASQNLTVARDITLPVIKLTPVATDLKGVTVTARQRRPMTKSVDGKLRIDVARSYLTDLGNALEVLKHAPGISVSREGDISLSSLGGTALYVNGKRVRLQGNELAAYLRTLSAGKIKRIEASTIPNARYEADGAGGIINIVLNATEDAGFFISTSHGLAYWEYLRTTSDLALSHNTEKWQLGLNYSHAIGHYAMGYGSDRVQEGVRNLSVTDDVDKRNTFAGGLDVVWQPNDRHKLSLNASANLLGGPGLTLTETQVYHKDGTPDKLLRAMNDYQKQRNLRYGGNLSYSFTPSERHALSVSADWIRFEGMSKCRQPNSYFTPRHALIRSDIYYSEPHKDIDIYSLMADYKYDTGKGGEQLLGFKLSAIRSKNDFRFEANSQLDLARSNHFNYKEKNAEAYVQSTWQLGKWQLSGGLRLEYMLTDNLLRPYNTALAEETDKERRLKLFPNLSVGYRFGEQTKLSAQYSRRQDKPRYEDLNPFEYLLDELTYWKGNPFLKPQTGDKVALNLSLRHLSVNLSYNRLNNYFTSLTDAYGDDKVVMTTKNIGRQTQWGMEIVYSRRLTAWWDINSNVGLFHFTNRLDYEQYRETYRRPSLTLSVSNDVSLPGKIKMELSGRYRSKRQGGSYDVARSSGSVDMGLNRAFLHERLRLSLLMTDIFHTERWDGYGRKGTLDTTSWGYSESRQVMLRARYTFGKRKFKARETSIEEAERL